MAGRITAPEEVISVAANNLFHRMLQSAHKQGKGDSNILEDYVLVGIDPGETTGLAIRRSNIGFVADLYQLNTKQIGPGMDTLFEHIEAAQRQAKIFGQKILVILEDYKVYSWKADDHSWSPLHTSEFIGAIKYRLHQLGIPYHLQMASEAKRWADDEKLTQWDVYAKGLKHSRDALRHIITYAFFGQPTKDT